MEVLVFFKDPDANTTEHIAQLEHKHQWPQVEACKTDGAHGCFNAPMLVCDPSDGLCSGPDLARHLQIGRLALIFTGSSSQLPIVEEPRSTFNRFFMMLLWGLVGAWGALGAPQFGWPTTFESNGQDCGPQLFQTHMGRHKQTRQSKVEAWQRHAYLVGTSHKAGTEMLHNTMRRAFDVLGGMDSCNYDRGGGPITSVAPKHQDCHLHPARIRYTHHMSGDDLRELRGLTSGAGGFRGVMMIRDPLDMIISSYVYHHRGAEADTELGVNMTEMSPEVGIPEMADRMYAVLSPMVDAYKVMKPDMMAARFEDFTRSSKSFNRTVEEIVRFLFRDEITEKQRQAILDDAVNEDLNRADSDGYAFRALSNPRAPPDGVNSVNHSNDDAEMMDMRRYLPLVKPHIYADILKLRNELGYKELG